MLADQIAMQQSYGVQYWPVFLRVTGEHAGCCGLRPCESGPLVYELGFHLRPALWGRGLATEAAGAAIAFGFSELNAAALVAGHHPENAASRHMLIDLGFRHNGDQLYPPTGLMHPTYRLTAREPTGAG